MKEMWNKRYSEEEYAYGLEPNEYLKAKLEELKPGKLFLPGEGEGRNAVYAAQQGWEVDALDYSPPGRTKTMALAKKHNVSIQYTVSDITDADLPEQTYDAIGLIYFHLPPDLRNSMFPKLATLLKPGGWLIIEVFSKDQLGRASGGPKMVDFLLTTETLRNHFPDFTIRELEQVKVTLREGRYHEGDASVVRMFAQRKS